ncbi:MAG: transposase [Gammaproteobacteria bacterium]|nr:transposase [Gammaproteobacteria bacterium]
MSSGAGSVGRSYREGISIIELAERFPNEESAIKWVEKLNWPNGEMCCMRCGSVDVYRVKSGKPMPYRCRDCKRYFSLKTGAAMEASNLPLKKWVWAIYLMATNLKGMSAVKLHRDLIISYRSARFMFHRIREGLAEEAAELDRFAGPIEVDESWFGGLEENKHAHKSSGPVAVQWARLPWWR